MKPVRLVQRYHLMIRQKVLSWLNTKLEWKRHSLFVRHVHRQKSFFSSSYLWLCIKYHTSGWKQQQAFIWHMNLQFGEGLMRTASLCSTGSSRQLEGWLGAGIMGRLARSHLVLDTGCHPGIQLRLPAQPPTCGLCCWLASSQRRGWVQMSMTQ